MPKARNNKNEYLINVPVGYPTQAFHLSTLFHLQIKYPRVCQGSEYLLALSPTQSLGEQIKGVAIKNQMLTVLTEIPMNQSFYLIMRAL